MVAHRLDLPAVGQTIGFAAEVDGYSGAVGKARLLNVSVRCEKAMVGHFGVADRASNSTYIFITLSKAFFVLVEYLAGEHEHRRRAI